MQRRAAFWASNSRWIPLSYCWSKCCDDCIQEFNWHSIQKCHKHFSICCIHGSLHHRNSLPFNQHFQLSQFPTSSIYNTQPAASSINSFHFLFFVNSPFLWYTIPHVILQVKNSTLFHAALRRFLLMFCCV